ncbi:MAG: carbon-nitrogen hydrolase family protein [Anaerovoracaceae bacterium]
MKNIKLAMCQMNVVADKKANIHKAEQMIRAAAAEGANVIALPEIWNSPYAVRHFRENSEEDGGATYTFMSEIAKELGIYLIGGSIPELCNDEVYNTSYSFNKEGELIGKHRKVHLFDVDIEGGISFRESDVFSPGDKTTVIETEYGNIGIAICFDVRFAESFSNMKNVNLIVLPAAFNMTTGPAHWSLLTRMRALDNQVYFASVSSARDMSGHYQAWGHSMVANPWGEVMVMADETEQVLTVDLDLEYVKKVRRELPLGIE